MRKSFKQVREDYQKRVSQGEPRDDVIASLHADGLSIIESIKAVRTLYGVGLGDAKQIVTAHPVWAEVVRNTQPLHEKMIKVMMDAHDGMKDRPLQTYDGLAALAALRSKLDSASSLEVIHENGHLFNAHFTFNSPAKTEEVDELERSLHVPLPIAYQQFLLQYNGALLYYDDEYGQWGFKLYGTADFLPTNISYWKMYEDEWPTSYLVFAESFGDADILILDTAHFVNEKDCQVIDGDRGYPLRMWKSAAQSFGDWLDRLVVAQGAKYWRWR